MSIDVNVQNDLVIVTESSEDITVNVSNAAGPAGVGVPVGGSTGQVLKKLSNTNYDTYWALDGGGVPYSGATGDVDLGEYELKAGQVEFDQTPTGTAGVGVMRWNDSDGTVDLGLKGGNVTLQVGQEQVQRVVNKSGINLLESAYQVVKVTSAQGQRLAVDLAQGNNDANSTDTIGIVTETINNNQEGFITTSGIIRGINTTGSLQGETWVDGDVLYLSPTTAGAITKVKPTAPNHSVILGYVVYAHGVNGKIFVKCENGYEIGELHDCYLPTPSNNDGIFWNSTNLRYENKTIATALGYTPVPTTRTIGTTAPLSGGGDLSANRTLSIPAATTLVDGYLTATDWTTFNNKQNALGFTPVPTTRTLTINGTAFDLSSDRSWSVGNVTGTGTGGANQGTVPMFIGTSTIANSNLYADTSLGRLGINTATPACILEVSTTSGGTPVILARFKTSNFGSSPGIEFVNSTTINSQIVGISGNGLSFRYGTTEGMRLFNTGNLVLQNGGTFTDSGQRLQVQGDAFIKGSGATSATNGLVVQDSAGSNLFQLRNDGALLFAQTSISNVGVQTGNVTKNGTGLTFTALSGVSIGSVYRFNTGTSTANTVGSTINLFEFIGAFSPTSSTSINNTILLNQTINQTGGANGITRGLYVNPTLTAAADWRSIEWSNNSGWGLYGAGTAPNYLGGYLTIDTISLYALRLTNTSKIIAGHSGGGGSEINLNLNATFAAYGSLDIRTQLFGNIAFQTGGANTRMQVFGATGNLLLQNGGTFTDAGFRLDVQGTARVSGAITGNSTITAIKAVLGDNGFGSSWGVFYHSDSTGASNAFIGIDNSVGSIISNVKTSGSHSWRVSNGTVMTLDTSGNLGIGTTTPSYKLDVNGTARVSDNLLVSKNQNAATTINITNTNNNANSYVAYEFQTTSYASLFKHPTSRTYKFVLGDDFGFYNGAGAGDIAILNDYSSGKIKFGAGGSSTVHMTIKANGSVRYQPMATPASAEAGDVYYDSSTNKLRCYNGTTWNDLF